MSGPITDFVSAQEALITAGGGIEAIVRWYNWRTFSPEKRARSAVDDYARDLADAASDMRAKGVAEEVIADWCSRFVSKWMAYQLAGSRTMNWVITGPARFPVAKNEKAMATEMKRYEELREFTEGRAAWIRRRERNAERAALSEAAQGQEFETVEVAGVKLVKNTTIDRVQLIFNGKPDEETRRDLKSSGFRWSPREGAWQRQLTRNGLWAAQGMQATIAAKLAEGGAA